MNDLMPEEMPGQVNLADLPRDSRFKHDGCLRYSEPQVIADDALAWLNSLKIPRAVTPSSIRIHTEQHEFEIDVRKAIDDENKKYGRNLAYPNSNSLPFAFASHVQGGRIYLSPNAYYLLQGNIEERAYVWRCIAHEYWHGIRKSPMQYNPSSDIEEGLAQEFAERMSQARLGGVAKTGAYANELILVRQLMSAWGEHQNEIWQQLLKSRTANDLSKWLWDETLKHGFSIKETENLLKYRR